MAKKEKKKLTIEESVGDTSGFSSEGQSSPKRRKIVLFSGLGAIVVLIVLVILFLSSPIKVEFYYQDGATPAGRFIVDRSTKLLEDAPVDPTRNFYDFGGWYLNADTTVGSGLFNNKDNVSLTEYKFDGNKSFALYARWTATEFKVNYDCKGNANFNTQITDNLATTNKNLNPESYTIKHTLSNYEKNQYVEYLRQSDPERYVNSKDAQANVTAQLDLYTNETQKSTINLQNLSQAGWTFLGWFDSSDNKVETLNRLDPKEINLTAKWQKN